MNSGHESRKPSAGRNQTDLSGHNDPPPVLFKTWRRMYAMVIGELALLIVLFYIIAKVFR